MRILVIFTGGTIGSSVNSDNGYIAPDNSNNYLLLDMYKQQYGENVEFHTLEVYSLLSENLNGEYLTKLCNTVNDQLSNNYDGIIVTHGSDTLQYSAAALHFACGAINIPVMLVCSNYILTDNRANGLINFAAAVQFIADKKATGVFVTYSNDNVTTTVHHGAQLLAHEVFQDSLYSVNNNYFGTYNDELEFTPNLKYVAPELPSKTMATFDDNTVEFVIAHPGINWNSILTGQPRAVVIQGYHSGTLPTANEDFKRFAFMAKAFQIRLFLAGSSSATAYESAAEFEELGIEIIENMPPIAAFVYVWGE